MARVFVFIQGLAVAATFVFATVAEEPSLRVAFLGDAGTGSQAQITLADRILAREPKALFLLGDNLYDEGEAGHIKLRFDVPYDRLLRRGIPIRGVLGNHDVRKCTLRSGLDVQRLPATADAYDWTAPDCDVNVQLWYPRFGYPDGRRYYRHTLSAAEGTPLLEVFILDSNTLPIGSGKIREKGKTDTAQLDWLRQELGRAAPGAWKVLLMHHPFRTPPGSGLIGRFAGHGPEVGLGTVLLNLCDQFAVDAVLAGHNHFYARMAPEREPAFPTRSFVSGGGKVGPWYGPDKKAPGVVNAGKFHHFVLATVTPSTFRYEAVDDKGVIRDCGTFSRGSRTDTPCP